MTEPAFGVSLLPVITLLILYWIALLVAFRIQGRRTAEAAVGMAVASSRENVVEVGVRVPLGRWVAAMLLPLFFFIVASLFI